MITHAWRTALTDDESAEVRALVAEAAEYDDEAGFSRVVPAGGDTGQAGEGVHQLLVYAQPQESHDPDAQRWPLAAYLRLDVVDAVGAVQFVVRPEFRSLGVATLTFEKLGTFPGGDTGWCGTGAHVIPAWAHGDHPAADRMARRFGAEAVHRMWQLVKPLSTPDDVPPRELEPGGGTVLSAGEVADQDTTATAERLERDGAAVGVSARGRSHLLGDAELLVVRSLAGDVVGVSRVSSGHSNGAPRKAVGTVLTLSVGGSADRERVSRALLHAAIKRLRAKGIGSVQLYVDAEDETIVHLTRELSFEHDRTDVCYRIACG